MKAFITKYALTMGILKREVNTINIDTMVLDAITFESYLSGEWWELWEAARGKAEDMRQEKIILLYKQIDRLRLIEFKKEDK